MPIYCIICDVYCFPNKVICFDVFFPCFCSFLGKNLPCCQVLLVSVGMDVVLHVFSIVSNIF